MSDKEILEKAIEKAIDGGWKQDLVWIHGNVKDKKQAFLDKIQVEDKWVYVGFDDYISVNDIIFNHDFAKALWGKESPTATRSQNIITLGWNNGWKYHLKQMVIAGDPIKYLGDNI